MGKSAHHNHYIKGGVDENGEAEGVGTYKIFTFKAFLYWLLTMKWLFDSGMHSFQNDILLPFKELNVIM